MKQYLLEYHVYFSITREVESPITGLKLYVAKLKKAFIVLHLDRNGKKDIKCEPVNLSKG